MTPLATHCPISLKSGKLLHRTARLKPRTTGGLKWQCIANCHFFKLDIKCVMCHFRCNSTKLGSEEYILLFNSCVKFHTKVCTHCWNINKSPCRPAVFQSCPCTCIMKVLPPGCCVAVERHERAWTSFEKRQNFIIKTKSSLSLSHKC